MVKYKHGLFLNPYIESSSNSAMRIFPPVGLEYIATSAKDYIQKITVIDLRHERKLCDVDNFIEFIRQEGIDFIGVSITWDRQFEEICDLLNRLPKEIPLIVGGYKATECAVELLEQCENVDIVVRGEGEATIKEILRDVPLNEILGISYRNNGEIVHNGFRPFIDADKIIPPDRSLRRYKYRLSLNGVNVANL